jgi:hypothetical protein
MEYNLVSWYISNLLMLESSEVAECVWLTSVYPYYARKRAKRWCGNPDRCRVCKTNSFLAWLVFPSRKRSMFNITIYPFTQNGIITSCLQKSEESNRLKREISLQGTVSFYYHIPKCPLSCYHVSARLTRYIYRRRLRDVIVFQWG